MTLKISRNAAQEKFIQLLEKISGQNIYLCMQCGYCSGACPMSENMDVLPRKITHMAQLGMEDDIGKVKMYWICASCQNCGVVCPRGIDLPRVMEALRLMTLRKNQNYLEPSELSPEILTESPQIALVAAFRKSTS